jgi:hypothetical protein
MQKGICKLCLIEKQLLTKAHIIPDWMYSGLFDKNHKTAMVDLEEKSPLKRPSTGIYDSNIFCAACDNEILGVLENYGKQTLCDGNGFINFFQSEIVSQNGGLKSAHIKIDDYTKFKLFLVSLIWKMHLSQNSFFSQVDIGPSHAERLRTKILNHEKISEDEYETAIIGIAQTPDLITNMISTPRKIKQERNIYYVCLLNGLFFMFNISPEDKMDLIVKSRLRENGQMTVPLLEGEIAKFFLDSITKVKVRRLNT